MGLIGFFTLNEISPCRKRAKKLHDLTSFKRIMIAAMGMAGLKNSSELLLKSGEDMMIVGLGC